MKFYLLESRSFNKFKVAKEGNSVAFRNASRLQVALGVASSPLIKRDLRMRGRKSALE